MDHTASTEETSFRLSLDNVQVLEKAGEDGKKTMWVRGFCSTEGVDLDKQRVYQDALDFNYLLKGDGGFRWKHTPKDQSQDRPIYAKVGKPTKIEKKKTRKGNLGTWVEGQLFDTAAAREIYELGVAAQEAGDSLGMSVEGVVTEKDAKGDVKRAIVRNIALDPHPVNTEARVEMFCKFAKALGLDAAPLMDGGDEGGEPLAKASSCKDKKAKGGAYGAMNKADEDDTYDEGEAADAAADKDTPEPFAEDEGEIEDEGGLDDGGEGDGHDAKDDPAQSVGKGGHTPRDKKRSGKMPTPKELNEMLRGMSAAERAEALAGIDAPETQEVTNLRKALDDAHALAESVGERFGGLDGADLLAEADSVGERLEKALTYAADSNEFMKAMGDFMLKFAGVLDANVTRTDEFMAHARKNEEALNKALGIVDYVGKLVRVPGEPRAAISSADIAPHPADAAKGADSGRTYSVSDASSILSKAAAQARAIPGKEEVASKLSQSVLAMHNHFGRGALVPEATLNKALTEAGWQAI